MFFAVRAPVSVPPREISSVIQLVRSESLKSVYRSNWSFDNP